jgi:hypothetical protein
MSVMMPELGRIATGPRSSEDQGPGVRSAGGPMAGTVTTPGATTPAGTSQPHPFLRHPGFQVPGPPAPPGSPAQSLNLSASADWGTALGGSTGQPVGKGAPSPMRARRSTTGSVPDTQGSAEAEAAGTAGLVTGAERVAATSAQPSAATGLVTSQSKRFSMEGPLPASGAGTASGSTVPPPHGLPPLPGAPPAPSGAGSGRLPPLGRYVNKTLAYCINRDAVRQPQCAILQNKRMHPAPSCLLVPHDPAP